MINREDMLELTRRMTPARTSFTRIAGCYVDADGDLTEALTSTSSNSLRQKKQKISQSPKRFHLQRQTQN